MMTASPRITENMVEHHLRRICDDAGVDYAGFWPSQGLVLFSSRETHSTLCLPFLTFTQTVIREHVVASNKAFGIEVRP